MAPLSNYLRVSPKYSSFARPSFILSRLVYDKRGNEMFRFWWNTLYKRAFRSNGREIRGTSRPNSFTLKEFLRETEASERSQRLTIFNVSLSQHACKLITTTTIRENRFCRRFIYCTNTYWQKRFTNFNGFKRWNKYLLRCIYLCQCYYKIDCETCLFRSLTGRSFYRWQ